MIKLSITEAQQDTIRTALTIAISQYDASVERVKALNGSTELTGVDWALVEEIGKQRRDALALVSMFMPIAKARKVRAKPKRKSKR